MQRQVNGTGDGERKGLNKTVQGLFLRDDACISYFCAARQNAWKKQLKEGFVLAHSFRG